MCTCKPFLLCIRNQRFKKKTNHHHLKRFLASRIRLFLHVTFISLKHWFDHNTVTQSVAGFNLFYRVKKLHQLCVSRISSNLLCIFPGSLLCHYPPWFPLPSTFTSISIPQHRFHFVSRPTAF